VRRHLAALGGTVAIVALLFAASPAVAAECPDADLVPALDNTGRVESAVLCLLNQERAAAHLHTVKRAPKLDLSARFHTASMVTKHFLSHEWPGHPSLLARVRGFGYFNGARGGIYAENIGAGPSYHGTAAAMVASWMTSTDHRANILYGAFRDVGISAIGAPRDRAFFADFPSTVFTTDFATRYERRRCVRPRRTVPRSGSATPRQGYCRR
jgi:uncharacterized protein YkwD